MKFLGCFVIFIELFDFVTIVVSQTCPDNIEAFVACSKEDDCTKYDLDCIQINGVGYCCGQEVNQTTTEGVKTLATVDGDVEKATMMTTLLLSSTSVSTTIGYKKPLSVDDVCFDNLGECTRKVNMCGRSEYKRLLVKYCPKSCGFCNETLNHHAQFQINTPYKGNCTDAHQACESRYFMCNVKRYDSLMRKNCRYTCRMC